MTCEHGKPIWYIRGCNILLVNRVGLNCVSCIMREIKRW
jgi:hypothetical protein